MKKYFLMILVWQVVAQARQMQVSLQETLRSSKQNERKRTIEAKKWKWQKIFLYVTKYFFIDACLPFLVLYIKKLPCKAFKYFSLLFAHVDIILDGAPYYKTALFRQCFYRKFSFRYFKINCWKRLVKKMHAFALSLMDQKKKKKRF